MDGEQNNMNMGGGESKGGSAGPIIGIIVILAIIILGGLYFWSQRSADDASSEADTAAALNAINAQSTADDTSTIEADLNTTQIENLDAEMNAS